MKKTTLKSHIKKLITLLLVVSLFNIPVYADIISTSNNTTTYQDIDKTYTVEGTTNTPEGHFMLTYPVGNSLKPNDTINVSYNAKIDKYDTGSARIVTKIVYDTTNDTSAKHYDSISSAYLANAIINTGSTSTLNCNYTIPANSKYLKIFITFVNLNSQNFKCEISNLKITKNNEKVMEYPVNFELYNFNGTYQISNTIYKNTFATNDIYGKWYNKKANFLGDSITAGANTDKTYHQYLKEMLGLSEARNYGKNGSTIGWGSDDMARRSLTMDNDADLIVVFGGTNDFNLARPLGNFYKETNGNKTLFTDIGYFKGALNTLCKNLKDKYPNKQIVICTPIHRGAYNTQSTDLSPNANGIYLEAYVDAIKEACKIWNIPCCDLWSFSGLQPNDATNKSLYFHTDDALHPNANGHEKIAEYMTQFLNNVA